MDKVVFVTHNKGKIASANKQLEGVDFKIFEYDLEEPRSDDIKYISENDLSQYCVVMECGLNTYEGVQNRQDACIRINVMYNKNIWVTTNYKAVARVQKMKELRLLNEYEIPQHIDENNEEARAFIEQMMREYDINK